VTILAISHDLTIFQIESPKFQIKSQIKSQCFKLNLCISNCIAKTVEIAFAIGICPLLGLGANFLQRPARSTTDFNAKLHQNQSSCF